MEKQTEQGSGTTNRNNNGNRAEIIIIEISSEGPGEKNTNYRSNPTSSYTEEKETAQESMQRLTVPLKPPNEPDANTASGRPFHARS